MASAGSYAVKLTEAELKILRRGLWFYLNAATTEGIDVGNPEVYGLLERLASLKAGTCQNGACGNNASANGYCSRCLTYKREQGIWP